MFRKVSMLVAAALICLPPGIDAPTGPSAMAGSVGSLPPVASCLLSPGDLAAMCGCLFVLCLLHARARLAA